MTDLSNVSASLEPTAQAPKRESLKDFHARMRRIAGLAIERPVTRRVGSWIKWHCGDRVFDENDPRWIGRIDAISNGVIAKVKWDNSEWISYVPLEKLRKAPAND